MQNSRLFHRLVYLVLQNTILTAFKMWCYLGKNQDRFTFALSREDAMQYCGFSKNTYTAAVNELIEKKFLKQSEQQKNYYLFYELPKEYKQE